MHSGTSQWVKASRNRLLFSPFAPYAALPKAKTKARKKTRARKDLARNESEPVLIATDRTDKSRSELKGVFPSPYTQPSPRSLPISPGLNQLPATPSPGLQSASRTLFQAAGNETRLTQVIAELQTYKQECKRLKDQLSQVKIRPSSPQLVHLEDQIQTLKAENWELKVTLQRLTSRKTLPLPRKSTKKTKAPIALSTPKFKPKSPSLKSPAQGQSGKWSLEGLVGKVGEEEVWALLRHMAYRLQLEGLGKEKLTEIIGEKVGEKDLERVFITPPFAFLPTEAALLTRYVLQIASTHQSKDIIKTLSGLLPILPIFPPSETILLTQELHSHFRPHSQALLTLCQTYDPEGNGWIPPELFCKALEKVGILLREETIRYLELLCYSQRKELDQVPYRELLSDYLEDNSTSVASSLLSHLAMYLKSSGLRPKDLFACENGHISPESLIQGLHQIPDLVLTEEDIMCLLEALQAPEVEEIGIEMEEMERIMREMGVEVGRKRLSEVQRLLHQSQASLPYVKQVSFLGEK